MAGGVALAVPAAASPTAMTLASPGPTPFAACTADHPEAQQQAGSTLYPGSEIEPRSARFGHNVVAEYQQDRWDDGGARGLVVSVSHDDGGTWHRVTVPGLTYCSGGQYLRASDPWISFGPDGTLYAISLSFWTLTDSYFPNAILVSTSTDFGDTWSVPAVVTADNTGGLDKESITADPNDARYVYAAWDRIVSPGGSTHASVNSVFQAKAYKSQTFIARSTDGGAHWQTPQPVFVDASFSGSIGSIVRPLGDGHTVLDALVTYGNATWKGGSCASISVLRSGDRGATWTPKPTIVAPLTCTYGGARNPDTGAFVRSGGLVDAVVDGTTAYIVWEDGSATEPTTGHIFFSQSSDGGVTWSTPTIISKSPAEVDAFIPTVVVNQDHTVGVSYYDFRNNTPGGIASTDLWLVRCPNSCTSAASWSEARVTPDSFDLSAAPVASGEFLGDYMGMTAQGSAFEPFFIQSGTPPVADGPTDAFFAAVA
jgi:hypothetical protein